LGYNIITAEKTPTESESKAERGCVGNTAPPELQISFLSREARQSKFAIRILLKKGSDFVKQTHQNLTLGIFSRPSVSSLAKHTINATQQSRKKNFTTPP
jgi:hypothetical protein